MKNLRFVHLLQAGEISRIQCEVINPSPVWVVLWEHALVDFTQPLNCLFGWFNASQDMSYKIFSKETFSEPFEDYHWGGRVVSERRQL